MQLEQDVHCECTSSNYMHAYNKWSESVGRYVRNAKKYENQEKKVWT